MRIAIVGPPGSGKGTQAAKIGERYKLPVISASALLREAVEQRTPPGIQARAALAARQPVPEELIMSLVTERLAQPDTRNGFILDGFPKNLVQAQALDEFLDRSSRPLERVLHLDVDVEAFMERLTGRRVCRSCGHNYNMFTDPPAMDEQCDACGGSLKFRVDDREPAVSSRLRQYENLTLPVIEYFREQDKLDVVQGAGEIGTVARAMAKLLDQLKAAGRVGVPVKKVAAIRKAAELMASRRRAAREEDKTGAAAAPKRPAKKVSGKAGKKVARKAAAKAPAAKKAAVKKPAAKKAVVSTATKKAVKKKVAKKGSKKTTAKKTVKKKVTARPAKKVTKKVVKKAVTKKVAKKKVTKKVAAKKETAAKKKTATRKKR